MVDAHAIDVSATDGVVTLTGNVGSLAEKRRAALDAGVDAVENKLEVKAWARDTLRAEAAVQPREGEIVREAVLTTLATTPGSTPPVSR